MQIRAKVIRIGEIQAFGSGNFQKRAVVLEIELDGKYPQIIEVEFHKDNTALPDKFRVGEVGEFHINLRGREWTSPQGELRVFNTIVCWKVEIDKSSPLATPEDGGKPLPPLFTSSSQDHSGLPF